MAMSHGTTDAEGRVELLYGKPKGQLSVVARRESAWLVLDEVVFEAGAQKGVGEDGTVVVK